MKADFFSFTMKVLSFSQVIFFPPTNKEINANIWQYLEVNAIIASLHSKQ